MQRKSLLNRLKLSCCPLSNYDFAHLIQFGENLKSILERSNIYIIAQRPALTFENLVADNTSHRSPKLHFQIRQKGNEELLTCSFPFRQKSLDNLHWKEIAMYFDFDYEFGNIEQDAPPFNHVRSFLLYGVGNEIGSWFSPERFLFNYWNGQIRAKVKGNIQNFLNYHVHYIGKSTDQHVIKRLTGHEHLQDILSKEYPFNYGSLPTEEITLLFFEFSDNIHFQIYTGDDDIGEETFNRMKNGTLPTVPEKAIYLDVEKALINALKPKHNKLLYKNYPLKGGGFPQHSIDAYSYSFYDPIVLKYVNGDICGCDDFFGRDVLFIDKSNSLTILKRKSK